LHIPLQSGDDGVLARMNRRYTVEIFVKIIQKIHRELPMAAIGCDVLGGFPGEDERASENTWQLLAGLPVSYLHVFPYSKRPGTLAASFPNQLPDQVKNDRVRRLRELDAEKRQKFYKRNLDTTQLVLVERRNRETGLLQGFSENYIPVQFPGPGRLIRKVVEVGIDRIEDGQPLGTSTDE
ncbi:MAG: tRNA (N(6)-L-threonylcarbamoyladenosine(37)-C(2))-methylthiotransferase MtaB, partial [Desulfobulbaceae bacterium]|nr:tRNA (N(6)-L-threonylcarbamoyladenosine(37)-C(2))-methylthiotransferase MtaB [Desulfobulbaceae bacterium]